MAPTTPRQGRSLVLTRDGLGACMVGGCFPHPGFVDSLLAVVSGGYFVADACPLAALCDPGLQHLGVGDARRLSMQDTANKDANDTLAATPLPGIEPLDGATADPSSWTEPTKAASRQGSALPGPGRIPTRPPSAQACLRFSVPSSATDHYSFRVGKRLPSAPPHAGHCFELLFIAPGVQSHALRNFVGDVETGSPLDVKMANAPEGGHPYVTTLFVQASLLSFPSPHGVLFVFCTQCRHQTPLPEWRTASNKHDASSGPNGSFLTTARHLVVFAPPFAFEAKKSTPTKR